MSNSEDLKRMRGIVCEMKHLTDELDSIMCDLENAQEKEKQEEDFPDNYGKIRDAIHAKIEQMLKAVNQQQRVVYYSAYDLDEHNFPIDNLSDTAFLGKGIVVAKVEDGFFGDGEDYSSEVLIDPSWLDIAVVANEAIIKTGDYHHSFLEGIYKTSGEKVIDGELIPVYELSMGS